MQVAMISRVFIYNGMRLPDPGADMSPAQAKDYYAAMYPELTTAEVTSPKEKGDTLEYTFRKTTGTKGRKAKEDPSTPFARRLQAAAVAEGKAKRLPQQSPAALATALHQALCVRGTPMSLPSPAIPLLL
jgi:PRTRC genetic system protein C